MSLAKSICPYGDGEFAGDGSGDFAALPLLRVMNKCVLENQAVFGRSGSGFDGAE